MLRTAKKGEANPTLGIRERLACSPPLPIKTWPYAGMSAAAAGGTAHTHFLDVALIMLISSERERERSPPPIFIHRQMAFDVHTHTHTHRSYFVGWTHSVFSSTTRRGWEKRKRRWRKGQI